MNAEILIAVFLLLAAACVVAGVAILSGAGYALLTAGACSFLLAVTIQRGRPRNG